MAIKNQKPRAKIHPYKEPSLLRKIIDIHFEEARRRKALRLLERQAWSYDFLSALLVRAGKQLGSGIQLVIHNKEGQTMTLTYQKALQSDSLQAFDNDIFNHLDDDTAVQSFIRSHSVR